MQIPIIYTEQNLTDEQYNRLKAQLDESWPKTAIRPILLEGDLEIDLIEVDEAPATISCVNSPIKITGVDMAAGDDETAVGFFTVGDDGKLKPCPTIDPSKWVYGHGPDAKPIEIRTDTKRAATIRTRLYREKGDSEPIHDSTVAVPDDAIDIIKARPEDFSVKSSEDKTEIEINFSSILKRFREQQDANR